MAVLIHVNSKAFVITFIITASSHWCILCMVLLFTAVGCSRRWFIQCQVPCIIPTHNPICCHGDWNTLQLFTFKIAGGWDRGWASALLFNSTGLLWTGCLHITLNIHICMTYSWSVGTVVPDWRLTTSPSKEMAISGSPPTYGWIAHLVESGACNLEVNGINHILAFYFFALFYHMYFT